MLDVRSDLGGLKFNRFVSGHKNIIYVFARQIRSTFTQVAHVARLVSIIATSATLGKIFLSYAVMFILPVMTIFHWLVMMVNHNTFMTSIDNPVRVDIITTHRIITSYDYFSSIIN